jgi:hypothetical protein
LDEVLTIRKRRHPSLAKAVANGFGIGAGFALAAVLAAGGSDCGQCLTAFVLKFGAAGAGIGAGIAAIIARDDLIFRRAGAASVAGYFPASSSS